MPFAEVNGQRLRFEDSGGSGPPVILSHGFLMDREMFAPQVQALAPEFRVITWDERGFGETEFDGQPFTYWDSARDCLGLLDHLGIDQAVLGGMSQGGFLSMRAALLAPDRVRALVLIDTQSGVEDPERMPAYRQMQQTWLEARSARRAHRRSIANLIIGDPVHQRASGSRSGRTLPRENMGAPGGLPVRAGRHHRIASARSPARRSCSTAPPIMSIEIDKAERAVTRRCPDAPASSRVEGGPHASNLTHPDSGQRAVARSSCGRYEDSALLNLSSAENVK